MKILYFSDNYAYNVMGAKRSLLRELIARGHNVIFIERQSIDETKKFIDIHKPDQIWLAHSGLVLPESTKKDIAIPVVGFGFSDPYYFTEERFKSYDIYVTNHYWTFEKYRSVIPIIYNPPSCDFSFHKNYKAKKTLDVSFIGRGKHPRFADKAIRIKTVNRLRTNNIFTYVYGKDWGEYPNYNHIEGEAFLWAINTSRIGLDIQEPFSPLGHRTVEYPACGTPIITLDRPEVHMMFDNEKEILVYKNYEDLRDKLIFYLDNEQLLARVGEQAMLRCMREHNISHRVNKLLTGIMEIAG